MLASLRCALASLTTNLLDNLIIILYLMVVKNLKHILVLFFKTVLFSCIRTDLIYRYHFSVFILIPESVSFSVLCYTTINIYCATTWHAITWHLLPVSYHLILDILNTWHLTWHTWLIIITYGNDDLISWHTLIYSSTTCAHNTPDMLLLIFVHW